MFSMYNKFIYDSRCKTVSRIWLSPVEIYSKEKQVVCDGSNLEQ